MVGFLRGVKPLLSCALILAFLPGLLQAQVRSSCDAQSSCDACVKSSCHGKGTCGHGGVYIPSLQTLLFDPWSRAGDRLEARWSGHLHGRQPKVYCDAWVGAMDEPKLGMEPFADPATRKTAGESKLDRVKEMSSRAKGEKAPTQTAVKEEMVVAASYLEGGSSGTSRKPLLETTEPAESEDGFRPVVRLTRATFKIGRAHV